MNWYHTLASVPTLRELRDRTQSIKQVELEQARRRLLAGDDPAEVLELFAHALSQKFMHHPTESLRQHHNEELLIAARELFGLDNN